MEKAKLLRCLIRRSEEKLAIAVSATQTAIDAATDEQTVPEHKYDTLALEAAYLAHGQAMRVEECEKELSALKAMTAKCFTDLPADLGAYVILEDKDEKQRHLILCPCAGGMTIKLDAKEISVVTPDSPIGAAVIGKREDDEVTLNVGGSTFYYDVVEVS